MLFSQHFRLKQGVLAVIGRFQIGTILVGFGAECREHGSGRFQSTGGALIAQL
jgi:hypothetical protein